MIEEARADQDDALDIFSRDATETFQPASGIGVVHDPDALIARRCAFCRTGYPDDVVLPYVVLVGADIPRYYDRDLCMHDAGYPLAVRLRSMLNDYGLSWTVVVDGSGHPVDAETYAKYAPRVTDAPFTGRLADDPTAAAEAAATFFEFLSARTDADDDVVDADVDDALIRRVFERIRLGRKDA